MNEIFGVLIHFTVLIVVAAVWHAKDERIIRVSLCSGMLVSFVTISTMITLDQGKFSIVALLVGFLVYGTGLGLISSFTSWLIGLPFKCQRA
jgi:hypothetical protein